LGDVPDKGTLGLRNWEIQIKPRSISLGPKKFSIPGFNLFHISPNAIRKAYRARAIAVHPDKNRDGRANEAFIAVEASASILADEKLRGDYDEKQRLARIQRRKANSKMVGDALEAGIGAMRRAIHVFQSVLGPFAFPVFILGALII
jgi:curved DNA-binding protein CbpA